MGQGSAARGRRRPHSADERCPSRDVSWGQSPGQVPDAAAARARKSTGGPCADDHGCRQCASFRIPGPGRKNTWTTAPWPSPLAGSSSPDEPVFSAGDEALLRGRAAFETTRRDRSASPSTIEAARGLRDQPRADAAGERTSSPRPHSEAAARPDAAFASTGLARRSSRPWRRSRPSSRNAGRRACASSRSASASTRPPGWLLPGVKSTSYAVNMAGEAEARGPRGRRRGLPRERRRRARSTDLQRLRWRHGDMLHTPSLEVGVLAGVTRATAARPGAGGGLPRGGRRLHPSALCGCRGGLHLVAVDPGEPVIELDGGHRPGHARRRRTPGRAPRPRANHPARGKPPDGGSLIGWTRKRFASVAWLS